MKIYNKIRSISILSNNGKYERPVLKNQKKIKGFYHVYCINDWKTIVLQQTNKIKMSGLYEITDNVFVSVITTKEEDIEWLATNLPTKFILKTISKNSYAYEYPALEYLYENNSNKRRLLLLLFSYKRCISK